MIDLKQALSEGKVVCGCAAMSCDPMIIEMLGHTGLPQFVGDMSQAVYRPECWT